MIDDRNSSSPKSQTVQPEVIPPESNQTHAPTAHDLPSHYRNLDWQDGAEFMAEGASGVPFARPAIKRFIEISTGVGQYSQENRLEALQWKWLLEQIPVIQEKIDILLNRLPEEEKPEPADFAAVVKAVLQASEKTADSRKRRLLKNALTNAFDLEQYHSGLTLRLISILVDLEYGDVELLGRVLKADRKVRNYTQPEIENLSMPISGDKNRISRLFDRQQVVKARLIFDTKSNILPTNIIFHHLDILERCNLIIIEDYGASDVKGTSAKVEAWNYLLDADNIISMNGGGLYVRLPEVTSLGKHFLKLVLKTTDRDEQPRSFF